MIRLTVVFFALVFLPGALFAQHKKNDNLVYVDAQGILRYTATKGEAAFFGVNYTTPFAYSYRAQRTLGVDPEQSIREDVYHFARLGLDAFRVHVWDTEISDTLGNLLENEHLRLFDFLLAELKKRQIKTIITPIAFWGNGYPEPDENTPGFSRKYGKGRATTEDAAIRAQEVYLDQFFHHVNPYTHLTYGNDPDVIAVELNNEPSHSGPKEGVTSYIDRLAAALRGTGWTKPVYYNISQSPYYAGAVAKANVDGFSFQWYPTGLVAGQEIRGNYLPNVDLYTIPYDTIPEYRTKTKMVYEFDAADLLQSCMYPAMAKAFRQAGFQWATQFAYDPMALAYANTEYQTHYLNLAYTPSKAISLMIAAKAFHRLPRLKNYGAYPADSSFDVFRVSYKEQLSEMNASEEFYYSNSTSSMPVETKKLKHIAGVGSSPVVKYSGSGAYFLDKIQAGVWRLEVMPDAVSIRDPFERPSPQKEVTRVEWKDNSMEILLPDLGEGFTCRPMNKDGVGLSLVRLAKFRVSPGTYLLVREHLVFNPSTYKNDVIGLSEFVAPKPVRTDLYVRHEPYAEVAAGQPFTVSAQVVGLDTAKLSVAISRLGGPSRMIPMEQASANVYTAQIPAELAVPGELDYRIIARKGNEFTVFPGNSKGNPFAWDSYTTDTWKTLVAADNGALELYNPTTDRTAKTYPVFRRGSQVNYVTGMQPGQLVLQQKTSDLSSTQLMGFQYVFLNKLGGRTAADLDSFQYLFVRARTLEAGPVRAKLGLTNADGQTFSTFITLTNEMSDIAVPLSALQPDSGMVLPRPYPDFLPLKFSGGGTPGNFRLSSFEKIELTIGPGLPAPELKKPYSLEVSSVFMRKNK